MIDIPKPETRPLSLPVAFALLLSVLAPTVATAATPAKANTPDTFIVGGFSSVPGAWPSTAALVRTDVGQTDLLNRQFCGATVIASRFVVTAAHCLFNSQDQIEEPGNIRVVVGITNLVLETPETEHVVTNVIVHPEYQHRSSNYNDIALLEVATDLAVPAATVFSGNTAEYVGSNATVVGWGAVKSDEPPQLLFPTSLQEGVVPIVSRDTCNGPNSYGGRIQEGQICAGFDEGHVNHCFGDSGGPLYASIDNKQQFIGVVTLGGNICETPFVYGVYSDVSFYRNWLASFVAIDTLPANTDSVATGSGTTDNTGAATIGVQPANDGSNALVASGGSGGSGALGIGWLAAMVTILIRRRRTEA